ncbi:MAG: metallophosphoesterase family protein [Chloroflexi bacterium]|nr:metallophosphoesterase family protein [Chloroflexota bacterium]
MKIAIISDTHNNLNNIQAVRQLILAEGVKVIIHCGDLTEPDVLDYFGDFRLYVVYGNGDYGPDVSERLEWLGTENQSDNNLVLDFDGKKIFVAHGHDVAGLNRAISSGLYDYVFHGHTHRCRGEKVGNSRVINPGSLGGKKVGARSFVILDLKNDKLKIIVEPFKP